MPKLKKWILKHGSREAQLSSGVIADALGIGKVLSDILVLRGYDTIDSAKAFLSKETTLFHDPFLLGDMDKAVDRIMLAVEKKEHITIYGDYDVDGVTSVSALYLYLKSIGAEIDYYIPDRLTEGYGINLAALDKIAANGTSLMITVDTGITAIEEAQYLKKLGMEMVITDHHSCQEKLPDAAAVVNPRRPDNLYPFEELAGVGVVFKLLCAIEKTRLGDDGEEGRYLMNICRDYCDLVAIGTIADVMSLRDENRLICAIGLSNIEHTPRAGIAALIEQTSEQKNARFPKKPKIRASYIGYTLAPKINAAGRLGDASDGVRLFLATEKKEAMEIAAKLCELNVKRQAEETRIAEEATELVQSTHDFEKDQVLVLANENWHHGIIGIVASRFIDKYNLPTLLISLEDGIGKGSGRSIKGLNLTEALTACSSLLVRYGGHELAAGFTVTEDKIDELRRALNDYAKTHLDPEAAIPVLEIDRETSDAEITLETAVQIAMLEPFGVDNPTPLLLRRNAQIAEIIPLGKNGGAKHTKLMLRSDGENKTALIFGTTVAETDFTVGDTIDVVYQAEINEFQNVRSVQMMVRDARLCEAELYLYDKEMELYRSVVERGERFLSSDRLLPDRNDFAIVYTTLKKLCAESDIFGIHKLAKSISIQNPELLPPLRMSKIKICLLILSDVGLIELETLPTLAMCGTELYRIHLCQVNGKVNLEGVPRYKAIKKLMKKSL